jgi:hypothetical protein
LINCYLQATFSSLRLTRVTQVMLRGGTLSKRENCSGL